MRSWLYTYCIIKSFLYQPRGEGGGNEMCDSPPPTLAVRTDDDATVCTCNSKQHGSKEHVPFWNLRSIAAANVQILTSGPRQSSATRDPSSYLVLYYSDEWLQLIRVAASYREQRTTPCLAEERPILPPYLPLASSS